ncbi:hypothetical protein SRHO_G00236100 [Serrasalmus rhombeus]
MEVKNHCEENQLKNGVQNGVPKETPPAKPANHTKWNQISPLWDWTAFAIVLTFTVLQGALYYLPVGQVFNLILNLMSRDPSINQEGDQNWFVELCRELPVVG